MAGVAIACVLIAVATVGLATARAGDAEVAVPYPLAAQESAPTHGTDLTDDAAPRADLADAASPGANLAETAVPRADLADDASPGTDLADDASHDPVGQGTEPAPPSAHTVDHDQPTAALQRSRLVVHHVGDVNLDPDYLPTLHGLGYDAVWDGVRDTFAAADLVIANLECAPTRGGVPQPKQFLFRCELDALPAMRQSGVDVVSLANNHSGDYGIPAMVEGVDNVEAAGLVAVGVGTDEAEAYAPRIVEVDGWRIAILGFGGVVPEPSWTSRGDLPGQATGYDPVRMAEAVAVAREDADLVIATVHWGAEGALEPRPEDVTKAEAMIAAGADVVFGHHAHRLQPLEEVDGTPVFWNLGNFVWPRLSQAGARTAVAEWIIDPDGTVTSCLLPAEIDDRGVPAPTGAPRECL